MYIRTTLRISFTLINIIIRKEINIFIVTQLCYYINMKYTLLVVTSNLKAVFSINMWPLKNHFKYTKIVTYQEINHLSTTDRTSTVNKHVARN